jgi:hypothetical protein
MGGLPQVFWIMTKTTLLWIIGSMLVGILIAGVMTEATFRYLKSSSDRAPTEIELVIPAGTADAVARGQNPPGIPDTMAFVVGDTLTVRNQDTSAHQLGPLWVPAGSSASLSFDSVQSYAYQCSFLTGKYLGLDVNSPVTLSTRIIGILSAGLPLGMLVALYVVFAIRPARKKTGVA